MPRVSKKTIEKLNAFIDSLPSEAKSKCAICNETLTHWVKKAEAVTGAGTATVTRAMSDDINKGAAPQDRVTPKALSRRVERQDGVISPKRDNKPQLEATATCPAISAMKVAVDAVNQLVQIKKDDPKRVEALNRVKAWIEKQLAE